MLHSIFAGILVLFLMGCLEPGMLLIEKPEQDPIYLNENGYIPSRFLVSHYYYPDGWMGDWYNLKVPSPSYCPYQPADNYGYYMPGLNCLHFNFKPLTSNNLYIRNRPFNGAILTDTFPGVDWGGVYWLRNKNWGHNPTDYKLNGGSKYVTFWARCDGENAGNAAHCGASDTMEFAVGGSGTDYGGNVPLPYKDIFRVGGYAVMHENWNKYFIKLPDQSDIQIVTDADGNMVTDSNGFPQTFRNDLSQPYNLVGAFAWVINGLTMDDNAWLNLYIDSIMYTDNPLDTLLKPEYGTASASAIKLISK